MGLGLYPKLARLGEMKNVKRRGFHHDNLHDSVYTLDLNLYPDWSTPLSGTHLQCRLVYSVKNVTTASEFFSKFLSMKKLTAGAKLVGVEGPDHRLENRLLKKPGLPAAPTRAPRVPPLLEDVQTGEGGVRPLTPETGIGTGRWSLRPVRETDRDNGDICLCSQETTLTEDTETEEQSGSLTVVPAREGL